MDLVNRDREVNEDKEISVGPHAHGALSNRLIRLMEVLILLSLLGQSLGGARRVVVFKEAETEWKIVSSLFVRIASDPLLPSLETTLSNFRPLVPVSASGGVL